jgi:hypothetical protein
MLCSLARDFYYALRTLVTPLIAACAIASPSPPAFENFLYTSSGDLPALQHLLERADIGGVQIVYPWNLLETDKDKYDFTAIDSDLAIVSARHKKLFVQVQDRFFTPGARNVPKYLMTEPVYTGGIVSQIDNPGENKPPVSGWVAEQWNPQVRSRYQKLLQALADRFDGKVYGINLPESAIDIQTRGDKTGFTCDAYFDAEMANLTFARTAFQHSYVIQYVNFWPCEWNNDHNYMARTFELAARIGAGLGGPDIVPYRKAQMDNSYPFFSRYKNKLPLIAMAVQEPTLTYRNPKTHKPFTRSEFEDFGRNYLGARIIFWSAAAL